eukprot:gene10307-13234_t
MGGAIVGGVVLVAGLGALAGAAIAEKGMEREMNEARAEVQHREAELTTRETELNQSQRELEEAQSHIQQALEELNRQSYLAEARERELIRQETEIAAKQAAIDAMRTITVQETIRKAKQVRPNFDVKLVLDTSESMAGTRSEEMFEAVCEVI